MKKRKAVGRALFYTRDSGGRHEMTPAGYVGWACLDAQKRGLSFDGIPERINEMIREGLSVSGDLFLDYNVTGNVLSRKGLDGLIREVVADLSVSHVYIPRRDRLSRPDDPVDGLVLENSLSNLGITLVFQDRECPPISKGKPRGIADLITTVIDYYESGKFRQDLAEKMVYAQIRLAKLGYSIGGRARYAFRRVLVNGDGITVRALADGEKVRMPGHHVAWVPDSQEKLNIALRIIDMLETTPASRVAAILTAEGIPSPDAGRIRTDGGVKHAVSGVWHQSTVVSIARNPLLIAIATSGRRSMGDRARFTPSGPRHLEDADYREEDEKKKPKVIQNPESVQIQTPSPAKFKPVLDVERHNRVIAILDARAGTQKGKPRSREPGRNPLGGRIFDMNCSWPMYREPYGGSFRYKCGLYQQSHGECCSHNHLDGPMAVRFLVSCLRQRLLSSNLLSKVEGRIRELAQRTLGTRGEATGLTAKRAELAQIGSELKRVEKNLGYAENKRQYDVVATMFENLRARQANLETEIAKLEGTESSTRDIEAEVEAAMKNFGRIAKLVADADDHAKVGEVFRDVNARLFAKFSKLRVGKRELNVLQSGQVTFGSAPSPIAIYQGPTGRQKVKGSVTNGDATEPSSQRSPQGPESKDPGQEGESLGNVGRGDWI